MRYLLLIALDESAGSRDAELKGDEHIARVRRLHEGRRPSGACCWAASACG